MKKQKDRLVELLEESSKRVGEYIDSRHIIPSAEEVHSLRADYILANGVIVPPCKVGDKVFYVHEVCDENCDEYLDISVGECEGISMQKEGLWIYCRYEDGLTYWHRSGETVFLTKEEAEEALQKRGSEDA